MTNQLTREELITEISKNLLPEDANFVKSLNQLLQNLGETHFLNIATSCYQRGLEHLQAKNYDFARLDFDRTMKLNPQADVYYQRAKAFYGLENYQNAIADLDKATTLQPQRAEFYDLRGDAYVKLRNYEMALANYNQAVTLGYSSQKLTDLQQEWNNKLRQEEEKRQAEAKRKAEEEKRKREAEAKRKIEEEARRKAEEEELNQLKSEKGIDYRPLRDYLKNGEWQKADEETSARMLEAMGESDWGSVYSSDLQNFPRTDLRTMDKLWLKYSDGKFGFSVQRDIWTSPQVGGKVGELDYDKYCKLADIVGWRKGGNWLSYPSGFTFNTNTLPGHLPGAWGWCWREALWWCGSSFSFLCSRL